MTVEANIVFREKKEAVVVPTEAMIGNTVQVVNGGRVQRIQVRMSIWRHPFMEIAGTCRARHDGSVAGAGRSGRWHVGRNGTGASATGR